MRIATTVTRLAGTAVAAAVAAALSVGVASASVTAPPRPHLVGYEADNGTTWTLTRDPFGIRSSGPQKGYADVGAVVTLGPAATFHGIRARGSANLAENIWVVDGPQAVVPGTHPLKGGADFDYGFRQANGTYYMTDGKYAGKSLAVWQIRQLFRGYELRGWVGIESNGTADAGYLSSVNGVPVRALLGITVSRHGRVTAFAIGFR